MRPALHVLALATLVGLACDESRPEARGGSGGGRPPDGSPEEAGTGANGAAGGASGAAGAGGATSDVDAGSARAGSNGASAGTNGTAGAGGGGGGAGGSAPRVCDVTWAGDIQVGTALDDQLLGMTIDPGGGIVVAGYEQGVVGVTNIEPDGNARAVVMRYGPDGAPSWKTVLDTSRTDTAEDVTVDPLTGNLLVVGRTSGAFPGFANQGQFDLVLATLAPNGENRSLLQTGNERPQHPVRVSATRDGQITVAGWDDTYNPSNYVAAMQDGLVATFSFDRSNGDTVKQTGLRYTLPPSQTGPFSLVTGVASEPDSSAVYVTSIVATNPSGTQGTFVTKLRADQTVVWNANISPFPFDAVTAVALSPSGELFVTGGTFLTLGAMAFGQEDAFVLKLDKETGAVIWAAQGGGADTDYPTALAFDPAGNVYLAGLTFGSVADGVANHGHGDIFAMKFSPGGTRLSAWQTGTTADDQATSVAVDPCGRVFIGGFSGGAIVPGHARAGGQDMFVMHAEL